MDISELAAAIDGSGVRFDYLLFDACFMSSVEALYDLRRAADYIVASPCEVMAHGFPYDTVIPSLFADDGARSYRPTRTGRASISCSGCV